jgi:hypothetical protein
VDDPTKRRWFQFSLRQMLLLALVVCVALGWWRQWRTMTNQSLEIDRLRQEVAQLRVKTILAVDVSDETKVRALAPYVKTGDSWEEVNRRLGSGDSIYTHGPGMSQHDYEDLGLVVGTYPDGEVHAVGCYVALECKPRTLTLKWLSWEEPTTWPKSVKRQPRSDDSDDAATAYLRCRYAH